MAKNDDHYEEQTVARSRSRYETPRIIETSDFETLALSCGKTGTACAGDTNSS